jgi:hypothetical protein
VPQHYLIGGTSRQLGEVLVQQSFQASDLARVGVPSKIGPPFRRAIDRGPVDFSPTGAVGLQARKIAARPESEILTNSGGKPRLSGSSLGFNLSHAGGEGLIGISVEGEIGVDLEIERPVSEATPFAEAYLSVFERDGWHRQPPVLRDRWLLDCWTRKEACLKALSTGLAHSPAAISAGAGPDLRRVEVSVTGEDGTLLVTSLELPSDSPGAAAILLPARE